MLDVNHWLTPVKSDENLKGEERIKLLGQAGIYAFGERTPGRRHIKPGDFICFYLTTRGIVAHAIVASFPQKDSDSFIIRKEKYQWVFNINKTILYLSNPIRIVVDLREKLDAFQGRDKSSWSWFVQSTRWVSEHDFALLTKTNLT